MDENSDEWSRFLVPPGNKAEKKLLQECASRGMLALYATGKEPGLPRFICCEYIEYASLVDGLLLDNAHQNKSAVRIKEVFSYLAALYRRGALLRPELMVPLAMTWAIMSPGDAPYLAVGQLQNRRALLTMA